MLTAFISVPAFTGTTLTGNGQDTFSMQGQTTVVFGALATTGSQVSFGANADMATFNATVGEQFTAGGWCRQLDFNGNIGGATH